MAKSIQKLEAIRLRQQGLSVKDISTRLNVSKSTASLWVRHITLSPTQIENLRNKSITTLEKAGLKGAEIQKQARLDRVNIENLRGSREFQLLTLDQLKIAGLCLYWAEGNKRQRRIKLVNSDPLMVKFFISWLYKIYQIPTTELSCQVGINQAHQSRETQVKEFWSKNTGIPLANFTKTSFKKFPLKKTYENFKNHYGTLSISVKKPARIYYKIMGQIHGLSQAT